MAFALSRTAGTVLIVSVGLNLFLGGTAVGRFFAPHLPFGPGHPPPMPGMIVEEIAQRMAPPDAEILKGAFAKIAERPPGSREAGREAIDAALRADPFDPAALVAALEHASEERKAFETSLQQSMVDAATRVSPAGRKQIADWGREHGGP